MFAVHPRQANPVLSLPVGSGRYAVLRARWAGNFEPWLFWFFQAGSRLFGPSEVGIHLFEIGYLAAFSVVLMWTMRDELALPWLS